MRDLSGSRGLNNIPRYRGIPDHKKHSMYYILQYFQHTAVCVLEDVKSLFAVTVFQANHRMRLIISFTNVR